MPHHNTPNHPKIKPILIQNFASGHHLNEKNLRKSSTSSLKESHITNNLHFKKPFLKTLRGQHALSKLDYAIEPYIDSRPFQLIRFFSNLNHLPSIQTLNLNLMKSNQYNINPCLQILMKSLLSLKNLTNLHVFFSLDVSDPKRLKDLLKYLPKINTLTSLSLSFDEYSELKISHINILFSVLAKLSNLMALSLKFSNPPENINHTFHTLASVLPKLHLLAKIELSFRGFSEFSPTIEASNLKALFTSLNNLKALSDITLHNIISHIFQIDLLSESFALLSHSRIRKLRLRFEGKWDGEFIRGLSQALTNFKSLETLRLKLSDAWAMPDSDLTLLGSVIGELSSLAYLSLTFPLKANPDGVLENVAEALGSLKNLSYLKLHFVGQTGDIKTQKITRLFSRIGYLKSLKSLAVDFEDSSLHTDNHLEVLAKSVGELSCLKNIWVEFTDSNLVTNQGVKVIIKAIEMLKGLSGLKLGFAYNGQIDNEVMEKIEEALRNLPCLYALRLDFMRCRKITRCNGLFKVLREMKNIGEIGLNLPRTKVTSEEIEGLRKSKVVKKVFWM